MRLETAFDCINERPKYSPEDCIGFNGQKHRKEIFCDLTNCCNFDSIVETGTFLGNTTGFMAQTSGLPVQSCEVDRRFFTIAKKRLIEMDGISISNQESTEFLSRIAATTPRSERIFFYLDAHWYMQLPLRREVEIIANHFTDFVLMIDDFQVPGDDGYTYDDYGPNGRLTLDYIQDLVTRFRLSVYFPSAPSNVETGRRRGCVVLAGESQSKISELSSLKSIGATTGRSLSLAQS